MSNNPLHQTITHAYANSALFRKRMDEAGIQPIDIQERGDLSQIPVLSKDEVIAIQQADSPFGGMLAVPMEEVRHIFFSPGPLYEPEGGPDDNPLLGQNAQAVLRQIGFGPGDIVINCLSYHLVPAGLHLDQALTALGCTVLPAGVGNSDLQLKMMADFGVTGFVGTPSYLMSLIDKAEEGGGAFNDRYRLEKALVSAEPLPPPLRQRLVEGYGLTIGNAYATAELGILALNLDGGLPMKLLQHPIVELVDNETGQPVGPGEAGEVVVTNFSRAYPLIRLGTGDLAVNVDPNPGGSKQEERMIILVGRVGDAVKVRGMFVHPNQLFFAARQVPGVKAVQGIVTRPETRDQFTVRVVLEEGTELAAVEGPLKEAVRGACRVSVDAVEVGQIPGDARGMVDGRDWTG